MSTVRVLFSNNYGTSEARAGWRAGRYPDHHLFGTNRMPADWEVIDLPYRAGGSVLGRLTARDSPIGELDQQWLAWRLGRRPRGAVVLSANHMTIRGLALLRRARLLRLPLVGVVHGAPAAGRRLPWEAILGLDAIVTQSEDTARRLRAGGVRPERIVVAPWGPDVDFAPFADAPGPGPGDPVVCLGKSNRDPETLVRALLDVEVPARVYTRDPAVLRALDPPDRIEIVAERGAPTAPGQPLSYDHVLADLTRAGIVAIPLRDMAPQHGLTEIDDAMACGKPVIVTRAEYFDLDIEAEGIGRFVDEGDVAGWRRALQELTADPAALAAMGARARSVARERWNSARFADGVTAAIATALGDG